MSDDLSSVIGEAVEEAWLNFVADMNQRYPAAEWPEHRLHERRAELLADAIQTARADRATSAGEMRAEARAIGAVLAERGDASMEGEADDLRDDMARVVVGEGPEPWMVETRGDPDMVKRWGVIDDPDVNMTRLEEWSHAARYALPHYLPPDLRKELGVPVRQISRRVVREEPGTVDELPYNAPDWPGIGEDDPAEEFEPVPEPTREPERGPERDGPDMEF